MSTANDRQPGGDHYKKRKYQHWDFVCDTGMHYLLGCATKYASRWRDKNGVQDLEKMIHYLDKAEERGVVPPAILIVGDLVDAFCEQLEHSDDGLLVRLVMLKEYEAARATARGLIVLEQMPTSQEQA